MTGGGKPRLKAVDVDELTLGTEDLLRDAIAELDRAEEVARSARRRIDSLRRRYRDERPGIFLLPTVQQLRRELGDDR